MYCVAEAPVLYAASAEGSINIVYFVSDNSNQSVKVFEVYNSIIFCNNYINICKNLKLQS